MTLRNGFAPICFALALWLTVCSIGVSCNRDDLPPLRPLPLPRNESYFENCVFFDKDKNLLNVYSTKDCLEPVVGLISPKKTNFTIGKDEPRNITLAMMLAQLSNGKTYSLVRYVFGECDVPFLLGYDWNIVHYDHKQQDLQKTQDFHSPPTANELEAKKLVINGPQGATKSVYLLTAIGPDGVSFVDAYRNTVATRLCNPFNANGTINFTQIVEYGEPSFQMSFLPFNNQNEVDKLFVDPNAKAIDIPPIVTIVGSPKDVSLRNDTQFAKGMNATAAPTIKTDEKKRLDWWIIVLIGVAVALFLFLIVGAIVGYVCWKKRKAAKAAALAKAEKTQASTMGTVTTQSQMTTAGTTAGDEEQINVVVHQ